MDYRTIFLLFLLFTLVIYSLNNKITLFAFLNRQTIISLLMAFGLSGTILSLVILLTDFTPWPLVREIGYRVGLQQMVEFDNAIPTHLTEDLNVLEVLRRDVDNDNFREWLVFYQFDEQGALLGDSSILPIKAIVYDNDQGDPPVIYPYRLRTPNQDFLSDGQIRVEQQELAMSDSCNAPVDQSELLIWGYPQSSINLFEDIDASYLSIFQHQNQALDPYDQPRDGQLDSNGGDQQRYKTLGFFQGDGGVSLNSTTQEVTTVSREGYISKQLAVRRIYAFGQDCDYFAPNSDALDAPISETIDFYQNPPNDILHSNFPEKIVMGYYISQCAFSTDTLGVCYRKASDWVATDFLDENLQGEDESYFGVPDAGLTNLEIKQISSVMYGTGNPESKVCMEFRSENTSLQRVELQLRSVEGVWRITGRDGLATVELGSQFECGPTTTASH